MIDPHAALRFGCFLGVLLALLVLERLLPWRPRRRAGEATDATPRPSQLGARRWPANLALGVMGNLLVRLTVPAAAIGAAAFAAAHHFGLFAWLGTPAWLAIPLTILALDLLIYGQHRLTHAVPLLWRLHRVHHADPELDATSALRFHPVEILLSMLVKMAAVVALGAPPVAVLGFEVLLNATAMFSHAAIRLPKRLEAALRLVVVTPDMHRIHHSELETETDSSYGFCLSCWDRIFGSYRAAPAAGEAVTIGLRGWRDPALQRLDRLLAQPLRTRPG